MTTVAAGKQNSLLNTRTTLHYQVANLSCASCVAHAEKAIAAVDCVSAVSVNMATRTTAVGINT